MKCLILTLIFTVNVFAADASREVDILSNQELGTKFVSAVQATKVENDLIVSSEFKDCAEKQKFDPTKMRDDQVLSEQQAKELQTCFKGKLGDRTPEQLKELSEKLNLKGFQLVRSQSVQDVTNFLSNRLYKKLTGINLEEEDVKKKLKSMSFRNNPDRKIVDQKDFVELYRVQLGKSALYEISRFCFTNLRKGSSAAASTSTPENFITHWGGSSNPASEIKKGAVNDSGYPVFGDFSKVGADKESVYKGIQDSFSSTPGFGASQTQNFFVECMAMINPLCDSYQTSIGATDRVLSRTTPQASAATPAPPAGQIVAATAGNGANACLTQQRLQAIRMAMKKTTVVLNDFNNIGTSALTLEMKDGPQAYNPQDRENGYNAISTITSDDFLQGEARGEDKQQKCTTTPDAEDCKEFLIQDDSYKQALHDTDVNLRLKTDIELELITKLNGDKLDEYLKDKGYFDLLEESKKNPTPEAFADIVKKYFDAQRLAALESIRAKVGSRQVDKETKGTDLENAIKKNVEASKEEKARLAQVVLFTNIVTSNLTLLKKDGDKTTVVGRNTLGLTRETAANSSIDETFFSGLKDTTASSGGGSDSNSGTDDYLKDIDFLDQVIGGDKPTATGN